MTLGSLLEESIQRLESLRILPEDDDEDGEGDGGLVKGAQINDEEEHIPTNEESMGGVDGPGAEAKHDSAAAKLPARSMQNRGLPYFEEMVENSRLGRIKRQKGAQTSRDGRTTVQWEVVEIGGGGDEQPMEGVMEASNKRQKTDV